MRARLRAFTTPLSDRAEGDGLEGASIRVAWRWLGIAVVLASSSGCLVTSTPQLEDPRQTPVFLTPLLPDTRVPVMATLNGALALVDLEVQVRAEDAGHEVEWIVAPDLGFPGRPQYAISDRSLDPSHIDDTSRFVKIKAPFSADVGCHSLTFFAAHKIPSTDGTPDLPAFDEITQCPKRPEDAARITWIVRTCSEQDACDTLPLSGDGGCPAATDITSCPTVSSTTGTQ